MTEKQERVEVKRDIISLRENYGTKIQIHSTFNFKEEE